MPRHNKRGPNGRFIRLRESATTTAPLAERGGVSGSGGRRNITLISAGWGSSGFYPREVLERDGPKVWPAGTHMYMDHPTVEEERNRPERSVKDLAAVLTSTPHMMGDDLVAEAEVFPHWRPVVDALAKDIGVSIRGEGAYQEGTRDGHSGRIIEELTSGDSVDFVTHAGAGGKVGDLIESARGLMDPHGTSRRSSDDDERSLTVDERERLSALEESDRQNKERLREHEQNITELTEARDAEKTRADRAEDALRVAEAKRVVSEAIASSTSGENPLPELPERAQERVREAVLRGKLPLGDDGKLITEQLVTRTREAIKEEHEYLHGNDAADTGSGVTGMGTPARESSSTGNNGGSGVSSENQEALVEAFKRQGMSETAAKIAAEGR